MSCGGSMMRASFRPLAHLVDAAAEKWLAAEHATEEERLAVSAEIVRAFRIGDNPELTFHGWRYLLRVYRAEGARSGDPRQCLVDVHRIATSG